MTAQQTVLSVCWWNLHDFAHFDPSRASRRSVLRELFAGGFPDLLAVCEATRETPSEWAGLWRIILAEGAT